MRFGRWVMAIAKIILILKCFMRGKVVRIK